MLAHAHSPTKGALQEVMRDPVRTHTQTLRLLRPLLCPSFPVRPPIAPSTHRLPFPDHPPPAGPLTSPGPWCSHTTSPRVCMYA